MTPGIYDDLARADLPPGLSYSGTKDILKSPFLYRWKRDNPQPSSSAMEVGQALHTAVLGKGARGVRIDGGRGRSEREVEVRAAGDIPLASDDFDNVNAMHAAVTTHDEAGRAVAGAKRREVAAIEVDQRHFQPRIARAPHQRAQIFPVRPPELGHAKAQARGLIESLQKGIFAQQN